MPAQLKSCGPLLSSTFPYTPASKMIACDYVIVAGEPYGGAFETMTVGTRIFFLDSFNLYETDGTSALQLYHSYPVESDTVVVANASALISPADTDAFFRSNNFAVPDPHPVFIYEDSLYGDPDWDYRGVAGTDGPLNKMWGWNPVTRVPEIAKPPDIEPGDYMVLIMFQTIERFDGLDYTDDIGLEDWELIYDPFFDMPSVSGRMYTIKMYGKVYEDGDFPTSIMPVDQNGTFMSGTYSLEYQILGFNDFRPPERPEPSDATLPGYSGMPGDDLFDPTPQPQIAYSSGSGQTYVDDGGIVRYLGITGSNSIGVRPVVEDALIVSIGRRFGLRRYLGDFPSAPDIDPYMFENDDLNFHTYGFTLAASDNLAPKPSPSKPIFLEARSTRLGATGVASKQIEGMPSDAETVFNGFTRIVRTPFWVLTDHREFLDGNFLMHVVFTISGPSDSDLGWHVGFIII